MKETLESHNEAVPTTTGKLSMDFARVMADQNGQAAVEMAIMLMALTGAVVLTNQIFDFFVTEYINGIMFFLRNP